MILWSILIPTVPARRVRRQAVLDLLEPQVEAHPEIEILVLEDNRRREYGAKMQALVDIAQGEYVNFVDDDDSVTRDYVARILPHLGEVDMVGLDAAVFIDGVFSKVARHSARYATGEDARYYYRGPSHLTPIRRSIVEAVRWDECGHYEADSRWSHKVSERGLIMSERQVGGTPIYRYAASTSAAEEVGVWVDRWGV